MADKRIREILDTQATVRANIPDGYDAFESDQNYDHVLNVGGTSTGKNYTWSPNKYWDFTTSGWVYLDSTHNSLTSNTTVTIGTNLVHSGDSDTYIGFTDDHIDHVVGGVTFLELEEDATDYAKFNVNLRFDDNVRIELGTAQDDTIYHDGTNLVINPTGKLDLQSSIKLGNMSGGSGYIVVPNGGDLQETNSPTINAITLGSSTASQAVFTDATKGLVSNAITGTGNVAMSASPTFTGTITAATANFSGTVRIGSNGTIAQILDTATRAVYSSAGAASDLILSIDGSTTAGLILETDDDLHATGKLGIGKSPSNLLDVDGTTNSTDVVMVNTTHNNTAAYNPAVILKNSDASSASAGRALMQLQVQRLGGSSPVAGIGLELTGANQGKVFISSPGSSVNNTDFALDHNGDVTASGNLDATTLSTGGNETFTYDEGSFTLTVRASGGEGSGTGTAKWAKCGKKITLDLPEISVEMDSGSHLELTGIPTDIRPTTTKFSGEIPGRWDANNQDMLLQMTNSTTWDVYQNNQVLTNGNSSTNNDYGTKACSFSYSLY